VTRAVASIRVLIVDDNWMNVEFFQDTLEAAGHTVGIERNGRAGRDRALAEPFDVILLDIQMPELDGVAVCRELRLAGVTVPLLALSAAAMPEQIARGEAAGFDEYLTKPISPAALRDAVLRHGTRAATV
jgi:CheY-like chemotaxis protein